ncbi:MAG: hypothetical protein AAF490_04530 [Chloroflexota bacterium]
MKREEKYIRHGIKAYEQGNRSKAKKYFKASIQLNKRNEKAWLWLAKAVTTRDERITCLKNILVINPSNIKARRSLKRLTGEFEIQETPHEQPSITVVAQQSINDFSPYFDDEFHALLATQNKKAKFNDVWEEKLPMCAYCATDISRSQSQCPKCKRQIFGLVLAEPSISSSSKIWFLLRTLIHLLLIFVYFWWFIPNQSDFIRQLNSSSNLVNLFGLLFISGQVIGIFATIALYLRKIEAFWFSIFGSLGTTVILAFLLRQLSPTLMIPFSVGYGMLYGAAVYFSIKAYPNFNQRKQKRIAEVNKNITNVDELDRLAEGFANLGMWGTAVLHWRQAIQYQMDDPKINARLANGYNQLQFNKRAIAQYKKALNYSSDPKLKKALAKLQKGEKNEDELSPLNSEAGSLFA